MSMLKKCCCRYSLRSGSFCGAYYTAVYFFLFAMMTGNIVLSDVKNMTKFEAINKSSSVAKDQNNAPTNFTRLDNYTLFLTKAEVILAALDFILEVFGFFTAILLIAALKKNKKNLMIPWIITIPLHTTVDLLSAIVILWSQIHEMKQQQQEYYGSALINPISTVLIDVILNVIHIYALCCVVSQYQELAAGRGTDEYNNFQDDQRNIIVQYTSCSTGNQNNSRTFVDDKPSIFFPDF